MYISKEDYDIYCDDELIEDIVDIDVQECLPELDSVRIDQCRNIVTVYHLDPDGRLFRIRDRAGAFKFKKRI